MPPPNTSACPKCELLALRLAAKNASKRSLNYTASQLALKTLIPGSLFISLALFTASVAQTAIPNQPSAAPLSAAKPTSQGGASSQASLANGSCESKKKVSTFSLCLVYKLQGRLK